MQIAKVDETAREHGWAATRAPGHTLYERGADSVLVRHTLGAGRVTTAEHTRAGAGVEPLDPKRIPIVMSWKPLPTLADFREPHETLVRYEDDKPDREGRRTFFAFWISDGVGYHLDEHGVRAQIFVTQPEKFAARNHPVREIS